MYHYMHTNCRA